MQWDQPGGSRVPGVGDVVRPDDVDDRWSGVELHLWVLVGVTLVLDVWLTYEGLRLGFTEGNPIVAYGIEQYGFGILGVAKVCALGAGCVIRVLCPRYGSVIALGLGLPWLIAVLINTAHIVPVVIS
jgi:hypothetical protein